MEQEPRHILKVVLFTDLVGSVDLKGKVGTADYTRLLARHRELFQQALAASPGGSVVQHTGDGFLVEFDTPSQAIQAALAFQFLLSAEPWPGPAPRVRVGIHQGEVLAEADHDPARRQLIGLAVDLAARVMGLALGGQILLTRSVFDDARQYVRRHPPVGDRPLPPIRWVDHGRYLFKGATDPIEICEVGAEGLAPLVRPPDGEKARRAVAADEEETLGWRPAVGLEVPGRPGWVIERRLGEGGFGEVWLACHERLRERHVFKFCFDAMRLRSFKREVTLFRLLREALGRRDDLVPLYGVELASAPYYVESEYVPAGNLLQWSDGAGGIAAVELATRLRLVSQTARAAAAAHSVGVIHKDIKPSNILIGRDGTGEPKARLCDFGIGVLTDRTRIRQVNVTEAGFTESLADGNDSSRTGTRLYQAPEYLVGRPETIQGDIYALGVLLYQMVVGDLNRPLGQGWQREVADELLREDIASCVDVDAEKRLTGAEELARSLERLDARRSARTEAASAARRAASRRRLARWATAGAAALAVVAGLLAVGYVREGRLRGEAQELARRERRANEEAQAAREKARQQRDLALEAYGALVFQIQDKLDARAGTHALKEALLDAATAGLDRLQASLGGSDVQASRAAAMAMVKLGSLLQATGRTARGLTLLEHARGMLKDLAAGAGADPKALHDLTAVYAELARAYLAAGKAAAALESANAAQDAAARVRADSPFSRRARIVAEGTLGDLELEMGKAGAALEHFRRQRALLEGAVQADPAEADAHARNLAGLYVRLGDVGVERNDTRGARECYLASLALAQGRAGEPGDVRWRRQAALVHARLSDLDWTEGRTREALEQETRSLAVVQSLAAAQKDDAPCQDDLAGSLGRMGGLYLRLGREGEALEAHEKSLAIRRALAARDAGSAAARRSLSTALLETGWVYLRLARPAEAMRACQEALRLREELVTADPDSPRARRDLSIALNDVGDAYQSLDRHAEALESFRKALEAVRPLAGVGGATARRDVGIGEARVAQAEAALGRLEDAARGFQRALEIHQRLADADGANAEARRDVAIVCFRLGGVQMAMKKPAQAEPFYARALAIYEALANESGDADSRHDQATAYNRMGDVKLELGQGPSAMEFYGKSLAVAQAAAAGTARARGDVSAAYARLARACANAGDHEKAADWLRRKQAFEQSAGRGAATQTRPASAPAAP